MIARLVARLIALPGVLLLLLLLFLLLRPAPLRLGTRYLEPAISGPMQQDPPLPRVQLLVGGGDIQPRPLGHRLQQGLGQFLTEIRPDQECPLA